MTIALTVEDGTGLSDANTFVSLVDAKARWDGRGISYSAYADDVLNGALVRASSFLTDAYSWDGYRINGRDQALAWPRKCVTDRDGYLVADDAVPREIIAATCEIAIVEAATPGAMNPSVVLSEKVVSEQVGSIRVEYANTYSSAEDSRPTLTIVNDLIDQFLSNGGDEMPTLLRM